MVEKHEGWEERTHTFDQAWESLNTAGRQQLTTKAGTTLVAKAVIIGRGSRRFRGITFPARLRFTHNAGLGYRHYIEATFFGFPLMNVNESYLDSKARMELPVGVIEKEPTVDMAGNLSLWCDSVWLPAILLTDRRVRWEPVE